MWWYANTFYAYGRTRGSLFSTDIPEGSGRNGSADEVRPQQYQSSKAQMPIYVPYANHVAARHM